jgi:hypothetical protein
MAIISALPFFVISAPRAQKNRNSDPHGGVDQSKFNIG